MSSPDKSTSDDAPGAAEDLTVELARLGIDDSPVLVLGMHRSGTSMLARLLGAAGVFLGHELTRNHESVFFQRLNKDALDFFGCSWAEVRSLPPASALRGDYAAFRANTRRALLEGLLDGHFGSAAGGAPAPRSPWGWKDPRNCLTLPLYLLLFPRARTLYIERSPADLALSLVLRDRSRHDRPQEASRDEERRRFRHYLDLAAEYAARARAAQPQARVWVETRYEDLVAAPEARLREIFEVLELNVPRDLAALAGTVRADRREAILGPEGAPFRDLLLPPWHASGTSGSMRP